MKGVYVINEVKREGGDDCILRVDNGMDESFLYEDRSFHKAVADATGFDREFTWF